MAIGAQKPNIIFIHTDNCCQNIQLIVGGNVAKYQSTLQGTYTKSADAIGGRPSWSSGNNKIWFNAKKKEWSIGKNIGTKGGIVTTLEAGCESSKQNWF